MKDWKYYLLVLPFYILLMPFVCILLVAEFWIIMMAVLRLVGVIPLYFLLGMATIIEPRLVNEEIQGSAKDKLTVTLEIIKEEVEDSKFFIKYYLLIFK
jgi:hypothetical protein